MDQITTCGWRNWREQFSGVSSGVLGHYTTSFVVLSPDLTYRKAGLFSHLLQQNIVVPSPSEHLVLQTSNQTPFSAFKWIDFVFPRPEIKLYFSAVSSSFYVVQGDEEDGEVEYVEDFEESDADIEVTLHCDSWLHCCRQPPGWGICVSHWHCAAWKGTFVLSWWFWLTVCVWERESVCVCVRDDYTVFQLSPLRRAAGLKIWDFCTEEASLILFSLLCYQAWELAADPQISVWEKNVRPQK